MRCGVLVAAISRPLPTPVPSPMKNPDRVPSPFLSVCRWPAYTTAAAAKEKLLYALYNCRDMDLN